MENKPILEFVRIVGLLILFMLFVVLILNVGEHYIESAYKECKDKPEDYYLEKYDLYCGELNVVNISGEKK